jgi:RimJ/RimL family protein N-acetyltransferase
MISPIRTERLLLRPLHGDNPVSGRILAKCGFVRSGDVMQWCEARGQAVKCHRLTPAIDRRRQDSESARR